MQTTSSIALSEFIVGIDSGVMGEVFRGFLVLFIKPFGAVMAGLL